MPYIYKITNKLNGKIYIGKTMQTIEERFIIHCRDAQKSYKNRPLYDAINKYGQHNFSIEVVEECSDLILSEREKFWIEYFGSFKNGYNATIGGDGRAYIDYDLVVNTYQELQNMTKTAELLNISRDSVSIILKARNQKILTSSEVCVRSYGKLVNMYDLANNYLRTFPSINEAARYMVANNLTGCKRTTIKQHITEVCRGDRQTAAKFKWKYA